MKRLQNTGVNNIITRSIKSNEAKQIRSVINENVINTSYEFLCQCIEILKTFFVTYIYEYQTKPNKLAAKALSMYWLWFYMTSSIYHVTFSRWSQFRKWILSIFQTTQRYSNLPSKRYLIYVYDVINMSIIWRRHKFCHIERFDHVGIGHLATMDNFSPNNCKF